MNNAGTAVISPIFGEPDTEQLAKMFQLNVLGPFYMVNSAVPHMPRGGRIINISSTNSKRGYPYISAYGASKAALDNLTWTWAEEASLTAASQIGPFADSPQLGRSRGITVNSVAPGPVSTDIYPEGKEEEFMAAELAVTRAENRPGTTADIGDAVLLLASEKSRWITGQYISVSGGVTQ